MYVNTKQIKTKLNQNVIASESDRARRENEMNASNPNKFIYLSECGGWGGGGKAAASKRHEYTNQISLTIEKQAKMENEN